MAIFSASIARAQDSTQTWNPTAAQTRPAPPALQDLKGGGKVGVGFHLGSRAGLSLKFWPKRAHAFAVDVGATPFANSLAIAVGYALHVRPVTGPVGISAQFTVGIGARLRILFATAQDEDGESLVEADTVLGLRVPLGLVLLMADFPVEFFVEVAPAIDVWQAFGVDIEGLGGARIYF